MLVGCWVSRQWSKDEVKMANVSKKKTRRYAADGRGAKYPLLEEQLIAWFKEQRSSKIQFLLVLSNFVKTCIK